MTYFRQQLYFRWRSLSPEGKRYRKISLILTYILLIIYCGMLAIIDLASILLIMLDEKQQPPDLLKSYPSCLWIIPLVGIAAHINVLITIYLIVALHRVHANNVLVWIVFTCFYDILYIAIQLWIFIHQHTIDEIIKVAILACIIAFTALIMYFVLQFKKHALLSPPY